MALFGNTGRGYTKTDGGNFLTKISHFASYVPVVGAFVTLPAGLLGAAVDAGKWLLRGKLFSALTVFLAGGAETATNTVLSGAGGFVAKAAVQVGSTVATGHTLGAHARRLTEVGMGGLGELVGAKPQVLKTHMVGIGSIGAPAPAPGPGKFVSAEASRRGESADAAYARLQSGQADHVGALEAAAAQPQMNYAGR